MHKLIPAILLLCALGCDPADSPAELREGTSGGDPCPVPDPAPLASPVESSACACKPYSDDCPEGLDCVPLPTEPEGWRCLAPMFGPTPGGGGYVTSCAVGTQERAGYYPWGIGKSPFYCSACLGCAAPLPGSLLCQ